MGFLQLPNNTIVNVLDLTDEVRTRLDAVYATSITASMLQATSPESREFIEKGVNMMYGLMLDELAAMKENAINNYTRLVKQSQADA